MHTQQAICRFSFKIPFQSNTLSWLIWNSKMRKTSSTVPGMNFRSVKKACFYIYVWVLYYGFDTHNFSLATTYISILIHRPPFATIAWAQQGPISGCHRRIWMSLPANEENRKSAATSIGWNRSRTSRNYFWVKWAPWNQLSTKPWNTIINFKLTVTSLAKNLKKPSQEQIIRLKASTRM